MFNPFTDGGYGHFIHLPGYDNITDLGRTNEIGGPYGPYLVDKFTKGNSETSTVYFTLSTWNPYTTVLMKAELELKPLEPIPEYPNLLPILVSMSLFLVLAAFGRQIKRRPSVTFVSS